MAAQEEETKNVSFEVPYDIYCEGCKEQIRMGAQYNATKMYFRMLTCPTYQFKIKCQKCETLIFIKMDAAEYDYAETVAEVRRRQSAPEELERKEKEKRRKINERPLFKSTPSSSHGPPTGTTKSGASARTVTPQRQVCLDTIKHISTSDLKRQRSAAFESDPPGPMNNKQSRPDIGVKVRKTCPSLKSTGVPSKDIVDRGASGKASGMDKFSSSSGKCQETNDSDMSALRDVSKDADINVSCHDMTDCMEGSGREKNSGEGSLMKELSVEGLEQKECSGGDEDRSAVESKGVCTTGALGALLNYDGTSESDCE